jgi:hypothetical protein
MVAQYDDYCLGIVQLDLNLESLETILQREGHELW